MDCKQIMVEDKPIAARDHYFLDKSKQKRLIEPPSTRWNNGLELLIMEHGNILDQYTNSFLKCDNMAQKKRIINTIASDIWRHLEIEEAVLYPLIKWVLVEGDGPRWEQESRTDAKNIKKHIELLIDMDIHDVQFSDQCEIMIKEFREHVQKQENIIFPELEKVLSRNQLDLLFNCLGNAKSLAPDPPSSSSLLLEENNGTFPAWFDHPSVAILFYQLLKDERRRCENPLNFNQ
jgi:hemerythrin-like domain-containing protein